MIKKFLSSVALAGVAIAGFGAVPASAQDYGRDGYRQTYSHDRDDDGDGRYARDDQYQYERRQDAYRRYQAEQRRAQYERYNRGYDRGYADDGYGRAYGYQDDSRRRQYHQGRRCTSGTTGAVVGAVLGGLLGREIGRGGRYNEPSTTGLILGAGGGALAGRAIERSNCR
ncbi:hypothetical protein GCM10009087_21850 [Sphingomonas oligophenolica]|uniref:17 kDa surface antigen n=1 Tax=Sphingomonas oligophenolica TaxID=301154 RepID=A0ABU9Y3N1_9SPHN